MIGAWSWRNSRVTLEDCVDCAAELARCLRQPALEQGPAKGRGRPFQPGKIALENAGERHVEWLARCPQMTCLRGAAKKLATAVARDHAHPGQFAPPHSPPP